MQNTPNTNASQHAPGPAGAETPNTRESRTLSGHTTAPTPSTNPDPPFSPEPNESANAFDAFMVFFNLTGKRRLSTVAKQTGSGFRTVSRWARDFDWSGRLNRHRAQLLRQSAATQDALAARQHQDTLDWAERSASIREREWEIADALLDAILRRLNSDVLDESTLADIARSFALVSRIGRLAAGLPNTPPDDSAAAQDSGAKEFNEALERIVCHHKAQQAAAAAAGSKPQPPSVP